MVISTGVTDNLEKIEANLKIEAPKTGKEIQSLTGKMTVLGRFLAKSAEKSITLFQVLKAQLDKNKVEWSDKAMKALIDLKRSLMSLPDLGSPHPTELMTMYILEGEQTLSMVMMVERDWIQTPVYFVSRMMQRLEYNYSLIKRILLELVHTV